MYVDPEISNHRCEKCNKSAIAIYRDTIETPSDTPGWRFFKVGEDHYYCEDHMPKE